MAFLACSCIATSTSCSHNQHHSLTASEAAAWRLIDAAHAQEEAAISTKNVDGVMAICSPNYTATLAGRQTVNKEQSRQSMIELFQLSDTMKEVNKIGDVTLSGNTATVMVDNHIEVTTKNPFNGQRITREQDDLDREKWIQGTQGWLLESTEILKSSR